MKKERLLSKTSKKKSGENFGASMRVSAVSESHG